MTKNHFPRARLKRFKTRHSGLVLKTCKHEIRCVPARVRRRDKALKLQDNCVVASRFLPRKSGAAKTNLKAEKARGIDAAFR